MKVKWNYIKAFALLVMLVFLYSFSGKRNGARRISGVSVKFTNGDNLYITDAMVDKLLIVSPDSLKKMRKETLDLKEMEKRLDGNKMIQNAEVYMDVNGEIGATVTQRQPIARGVASKNFYIDALGEIMPLSDNYSARVPLVYGVTEKEVVEVFPLLKKIQTDSFLKKHIISLNRNKNGWYTLGLRGSALKVLIGRVQAIDQKMNNFKVFYKTALQAKKMKDYKQVNLMFDNQVVCTKK